MALFSRLAGSGRLLLLSPAASSTSAVRLLASEVSKEVKAPPPVKHESMFDDWDTVVVPPRAGTLKPFPKDFKEYPERDLVNYPHPEMKEFPSKVRLGFIPDSWFLAFYEKTGVTGPYLFGGGLVMFLMSKEILVWEEEMKHLPPLLFIIYMFSKLYGHHFEKSATDEYDKYWDGVFAIRDTELNRGIEERKMLAKTKEDYTVLVSELPAVKRENIGLQLEAAYRERVAKVYGDLKRRLDYIVESELAKRRYQQKHMVDWIINQVKASITPEQEKAITTKCIADLKLLAQSA